MRPATKDEQASMREIRLSRDEAGLEILRKERQKRQREDRKQVAEMEEWWLKRLIETPRPLEEKLTLFWHGHFATGYRTIENSYHMFQQNNPNPFNLQNMLPNFLSWGAFKTNVGSNGRISIPEAEREALGIEEGDLVQIVITPLKVGTNK